MLQQIFSGKITFKLISTIFAKKVYVQNKHKGNKIKVKSIKSKLLNILNMSDF